MEIDEDKYTIVFPKEYAKTAKQTANMLDVYIPLYNNYYNYKLDKRILFFINKPNKQKSNGHALFNKIHMYSGSNSVLRYDLSAISAWAELLASHELAHSYQMLSTKFPLKRKIFRHYTLLEPNVLIPLPLIEGNAVLMESLFDNGGRLYSGYSKALLNALLYDDKLTRNLMLLNTRIFPYSEVRYLIGGFFVKYLYDRYGLNMVNSYFLSHSNLYLTPFSLGFERHFKDSFDDIFNDFKKSHKTNDFIKSTGEVMTSSDVVIDLNKQNDEVYFLSTKVNNDSMLNVFNIKENNLTKRKTVFSNTRVFKIKDKFYFLSNVNKNNDNFYGLYDEDFKRLENSKSKIFTHISDTGEDRYYFDSHNSFNKLRLYKNGDFIDEIDSSTIVDDNGDLYYFKNIGKERWLIKNNKKLFSFNSRYAFVVDKDKKFIYFISHSSNGSTLYAWNKTNKEILRVFKGDDIYNAKKINDDYFLISTIASNSHRLLKSKGLYFKEKVVEIKESSIYPNGVKYKDKDFKISSYSPYSSMSINSIGFYFHKNKIIDFISSDVSNKLKIKGDVATYKNAYLYTLKYENFYNDDFIHAITSTVSGQSELMLFKFLYKNNLYRRGYKKLIFNLGYEYLDKRKNKNSLSLSLKYNNMFVNPFNSSPSRGYATSLYANHIILDGVNVKGGARVYKKMNKGLFISGNIQGSFSTSKAYKNKISIENNELINEHIKAENYAGDTFNDWIIKSSVKVSYEKYLGFYSKYYLSYVKADVFVNIANFQSENDNFNEHIFGIKNTLLMGYNNEVDFIVKTIYNDIYGKKYTFEISMDL